MNLNSQRGSLTEFRDSLLRAEVPNKPLAAPLTRAHGFPRLGAFRPGIAKQGPVRRPKDDESTILEESLDLEESPKFIMEDQTGSCEELHLFESSQNGDTAAYNSVAIAREAGMSPLQMLTFATQHSIRKYSSLDV